MINAIDEVSSSSSYIYVCECMINTIDEVSSSISYICECECVINTIDEVSSSISYVYVCGCIVCVSVYLTPRRFWYTVYCYTFILIQCTMIGIP